MRTRSNLIVLSLFVFFVACNSAETNEAPGNTPVLTIPARAPLMQSGPAGIVINIPNTDTSQVSQYIRRIFLDKNGNLWFATTNDGVCRYDGKSLVYYGLKNGLSGNCVKHILQDKNGNFWFSTESGLTRFNGQTFTNYYVKDGLPAEHVWPLLEDKNGTIWVGTDGGLCRYDERAAEGRAFTAFALPFSDKKNTSTDNPKALRCIYEDQAGNLWFGTTGAGVCRYDGKNFKVFTKKDGLCNNSVLSIHQDRKGRLWFASGWNEGEGGVACYYGKTFTRYTSNEGMDAPKGARYIYEDSKGNLWFATHGVDRFDGKSFTNLGKKDGLANTGVQSIFEDEKGRVWIGTGAGLFRYDGSLVVNVRRNGPW